MARSQKCNLNDYFVEACRALPSLLAGQREDNQKDREELWLFFKHVLREIQEKEVSLALDQRCSYQLENLLKELLRLPSDSLVRFQAKLRLFSGIVLRLCDSVSDLVFNIYGSHVLQTIAGAFPQLAAEQHELQQADGQTETSFSVPDLFLHFCQNIGSLGWNTVACDSCSTHVLRTLLRSSVGYYDSDNSGNSDCSFLETRGGRGGRGRGGVRKHVVKAGGHRNSKARRSAADEVEAFLLASHVPLPATSYSCVLLSPLTAGLREDVRALSLHPFASPVLQVLVLCSEAQGQSRDIIKLITGVEEKKINKTCTELSRNAVGSRLLEVCIRCLRRSNDHFDIFHKLVKKWLLRSVNDVLKSGDQYATICVQRVLVAELLTERDLLLILQAIDFRLFVPSSSILLPKFAESCSRWPCCAKLFVNQLVAQTLEAPQSSDFPTIWPRLLTDTHGLSTHPSTSTQLSINRVGVWLLCALLKFPRSTLGPLLTSFRPFLDSLDTREKLLQLATDKNGSRLLEDLVGMASPIPASLIGRLVKKYKGLYVDLCRSPSGAFVVTGFYKSLHVKVQVKNQLANELQEVAEDLKQNNIAVYLACQLHDHKRDSDQWQLQNSRKQKAAALFYDILNNDVVSRGEAPKKRICAAKPPTHQVA